MKVAYLDTIGGIAGDMTLAAFISAGVQIDELVGNLNDLGLDGFELDAKHVTRSGIDSVQLEVVLSGAGPGHRHLRDILRIINSSNLSDVTKERSGSIFRVLAEAEATIHNSTIDKVHFHEVGAVDSIVDIVGAAICLELLGVEKVYTSPIKVGSGGTVRSEHGVLPVPAPATIEILRGYPVVLTSAPHELTTPTGAAIVKALSSGLLGEEELRIGAIGYGAGTAEFRELPNLLRVLVGEIEPDALHDEIMLVETTIDDMNPEVYPYIIEKLLVSGAYDAYLVPIVMKKGRPGMLLSVLADRTKLEGIVRCLHSETSTIGVRFSAVRRKKLPREQRTIATSLGPVNVKVILRDGRETISPEYEECRRIAEERKIPLLEVYKIIDRETSRGS